jgi:mono/diheme cytochrome c family protein
MTQCFRDEEGNRAMPIQNLLIRFTLSVLFLGPTINVDDHLARANDAEEQGGDKNSSSGTVPMHPTRDKKRGEDLYNASCVVCHGPGATGGIGPRLAGNLVLWNEQAFWKILSEGRHMMPPLKDALTEQQMTDIQAWLKTLP